MRVRLKAWYALASRWEKQQASEWYDNAHAYAGVLADEYGITVAKAAAVISVLSPATRWEQNLKDADILIKAWSKGSYDAVVTTYNPQRWKAYHILDTPNLTATEVRKSSSGPQPQATVHPTDDELEELIGTPNARKTRAFYRNILDPTDTKHVTIDRWILRVLGLPVNRTTERLYYIGSIAIKSVARELGLTPCVCQAIVWTAARNRKAQMETTYNLPGF